jgi:hypothetical protein
MVPKRMNSQATDQMLESPRIHGSALARVGLFLILDEINTG